MKSDLAALGAVLLWSSLATLGVTLVHIPPILLTGLGLLIGSAISLVGSKFKIRELLVPPKALLIGVYGLLGFHLALFAAFQTAPVVSANLINYLWPLLLVLLAPLFTKSKLKFTHLIAALIGFAGAAIAILSGGGAGFSLEIGYLFALLAAIIWATYSLMSAKLEGLSSNSVGSFAFVSGALALGLHFVLEQPVAITPQDWFFILLMGLGPLGGAFYLWDYALKTGNPQRAGLISFATPVLSTTFLVIAQGKAPSFEIFLAAALIVVAAWIGRSVK